MWKLWDVKFFIVPHHSYTHISKGISALQTWTFSHSRPVSLFFKTHTLMTFHVIKNRRDFIKCHLQLFNLKWLFRRKLHFLKLFSFLQLLKLKKAIKFQPLNHLHHHCCRHNDPIEITAAAFYIIMIMFLWFITTFVYALNACHSDVIIISLLLYVLTTNEMLFNFEVDSKFTKICLNSPQ